MSILSIRLHEVEPNPAERVSKGVIRVALTLICLEIPLKIAISIFCTSICPDGLVV